MAVRNQASPSRGVVLVVDTSVSMAVRTGEVSRLDRAHDGALRVLDTLGPGCRVALVASAPRGTAAQDAGPAIFGDVGAAREAVRRLTPSGGIFRLSAALDTAASLLERMDRPSPEIYVFTDLQWSMIADGDAARWRFIRDRFPPEAGTPAIRLIDCGLPEQPNTFVSSIERPTLAAGTDEPATIRARIETSGPRTQERTITATLLADGVETATTDVALSPAAPAPVEFTHRFTEAGNEELPRLEEMAIKVLDVHRDKAEETLTDLLVTFQGLKAELEQHMAKEEQILFPRAQSESV